MRVTIVYLGGSRVQSGCDQEEVELETGATLADAARQVASNYPRLAPLLSRCRWARNLEFASADEPLTDGDEVALIPPVAGGAPNTETTTKITTDIIDPAALLAELADDSVGATVLFVGTVRDHARGKSVERLEYEAYVEMAQRQLELITARCATDNPGATVAVHHRYGRLEIGAVSVAIAASAAHRDEAFAACRQAIELIKTDVPIWKKEITSDGEEWVGWGGG